MIKILPANRPKIAQAVYEIPTIFIEPDPEQPRKEFDPEYIAGLGQSIKAEGLRQPITVRANPHKTGFYQIITGECRWRAHCHAELATVRCCIASDCEDEAKRYRTQVIENMARKNMTLREEANAMKRMTGLGDDDQTIASAIGYSLYRMKNIRQMAGLSDSIWKLLDAKIIVPYVAEFVMGKVAPENQEALLLRCAGKTCKQAAAIVDAYLLNQRQTDFALACDTAGVTDKKADIAKTLAIQLMQITSAIEGLSGVNQKRLARSIGIEVAKLVPSTKASKHGALFIMALMNSVDAVMEVEK